ncbi:MAG: hypothetical protein V4712_18370 [Pseudomonadota bacterium]
MSAITIQQMADRVAGLMEERLGIRGRGLDEKLRKGGRLLPRAVRVKATTLSELATQAQNPKLLTQINMEDVAGAYDTCVKHLGAIKSGSRRTGILLGMASSIAFSLLVVAVLLIGVLVWRGYV